MCLLNVLLTICCIYLPSGNDITWTDLESLINQLRSPFHLLGNINAHNPPWSGVYRDSGTSSRKPYFHPAVCAFLTVDWTPFTSQPAHFQPSIYLWVHHLFSLTGCGKLLMTWRAVVTSQSCFLLQDICGKTPSEKLFNQMTAFSNNNRKMLATSNTYTSGLIVLGEEHS